ncbi:MAG TPA: PD-(D/E)XK nuclease family protein [Planctomycetota bacterium]|nr:PD-(D/E)XK nuclease family protein [Planctomycetota bacterium]
MTDYPKKPGFVEPRIAEDLTRHMHQSTVSKVFGASSCLAQYKYLYIDGYRSPPAVALQFGTAWDRLQYGVPGKTPAHKDTPETRSGYFHEKLTRGVDLPEKDVKERFAETWKEEAAVIDNWEGEDYVDLQKRGLLAIGEWHKIAQDIEPRSLHDDLALEINGGEWFLRGSLDMIGRHRGEKKFTPRDAKTSGKKWPKGKSDNMIQATHYSILLAHTPGYEDVDHNKFTFEVMVKNKQKPVVDEFVTTVDDRERTTHLRRVALARDVIHTAFKTGDFIPNRDSMLACSRKLCAFWALCEKEHGGTVRGEEV